MLDPIDPCGGLHPWKNTKYRVGTDRHIGGSPLHPPLPPDNLQERISYETPICCAASNVGRVRSKTPVKYIIDDGTGLLPCTQYERIVGSGAVHAGRAELHELGELLIVQGKLKRYKG